MKVELDIGVEQARKLRALENERANYRAAKERLRLAENERYVAQTVMEDAEKRLAQAEGDVAAACLEAILPFLNADEASDVQGEESAK